LLGTGYLRNSNSNRIPKDLLQPHATIMTYNGDLPTISGTIFTIPTATPAQARSGSNKTVNFFRVVNESGAARTFTIFLNVSGTPKAITPVDTNLIDGAAYDDVPEVEMPPGSTINGVADGTGVSWTINVK